MNFQPIVECKVNYESFEVVGESFGKIISRIPVATMLTIILPEQSTVDKVQDVINDSESYTVEDFHVSDLFHKCFIESFLKSGRFDCCPVIHKLQEIKFIIEKNILTFSILKSSLYELQVVELMKNRVESNDDLFYKFKIFLADLVQSDLEKLQNEMKLIFQPCPVNFTYYHETISTESIAKYLQDLNRKVNKLQNLIQINPELNLTFPLIDDQDQTTLYDISEYFGQILLGNLFEDIEHPSTSVSLGKGFTMIIKGFVSPMKIAEIIKILQTNLSENEELPWLAITVSGIQNNSKFIILNKNNKIHFL